MPDLNLPVAAFATAIPRVQIGTSLERACTLLQHHDCAFLVVLNGPLFVGVLPAHALLTLADGTPGEAAVDDFVQAIASLSPLSSGAEALRLVADSPLGAAVILNEEGMFGGVVTIASLLHDRSHPTVELGPVGGMATPLGVYLTDGTHQAGPRPWGLMLTGAGLFLLLSLCNAATIPLLNRLNDTRLTPGLTEGLVGLVVVLLFLIGMRLLPIAGTHAAEHMVVHALERQEPLTLETVRRMPRVHPRCGTNFASAAMLFGAVYGIPWGPPEEVRLTLGLLVTLFFWRTFGSFVQLNFTTRPPTDRQILGAIRSGQELVQAHLRDPASFVSPWRRIWNSGLLHVMAGSTSMLGVVYGIGQVFPDVLILLR
ncbi:MAG: DUF1385 domain-containing protein [Chthonomonas sp.]|nr:DUF1385 domain-containing protein [Chthonomonas sp.]